MLPCPFLLPFVSFPTQDQNYIRATADVQISVTKMKPDELIVLQFCQRPPLYPRLPMRASVAQASVDTWGELDPAFGAWSPPVVYRLPKTCLLLSCCFFVYVYVFIQSYV